MSITSTAFGGTALSGADAAAFLDQLDAPAPAAAGAAVQRGIPIARALRETGSYAFSLPVPDAWSRFASEQDASVNWTRPTPDGGMLECRYVRREAEYFIAYLSSHSGCRHACRFCHLTQTGQTMFRETPIGELREQLVRVLAHYDELEAPAERMNINFMARGEPLSNRELMSGFSEFDAFAKNEAEKRSIGYRHNLSTIFPLDAADLDLSAALGAAPVRIYWSLYSLDPAFRRRWLPRAQEPEAVMARLLDWQGRTGGQVSLHWAMIEGQNDQDEGLERIAAFVRGSGLRAKLNLVRYNPHSPKTGREAEEERYQAALRIVGAEMTERGSRVVPRVGFDVKASCGMFMK